MDVHAIPKAVIYWCLRIWQASEPIYLHNELHEELARMHRLCASTVGYLHGLFDSLDYHIVCLPIAHSKRRHGLRCTTRGETASQGFPDRCCTSAGLCMMLHFGLPFHLPPLAIHLHCNPTQAVHRRKVSRSGRGISAMGILDSTAKVSANWA